MLGKCLDKPSVCLFKGKLIYMYVYHTETAHFQKCSSRWIRFGNVDVTALNPHQHPCLPTCEVQKTTHNNDHVDTALGNRFVTATNDKPSLFPQLPQTASNSAQ